jgi:PrsW family intramembrane metalloprotease
MSEAAPVAPTLTTCHVCRSPVPPGEFCGACGASLVPGAPRPARRPHAFAANPAEHVLHFSVVSTLFPHLPHRRSAPFRIGLLLAAILLLVLGYARLTGPAVAAAALSVPLLYLLYLYEVEVYEDEPYYVIGVTFVLGGILGGLFAFATGQIVTQTLLLNVAQGASADKIVVAAAVFPLLAAVLMMVGPLIIYFTRHYDEALDGFTFGAASAMGFTLGATVVNLWPQLQEGLQTSAPSVDNALVILQRGLLIPFIYASVTGLIAGSIWLMRGRVRTLAANGWTTKLWTNILVAILVLVGLGFVNVYILQAPLSVGIYAVVAAVLLLWVRIAMHHMLLAEAVEVEIGPEAPCFHCHHIVPRMAFCPHCGIATRATPKTGVGRTGRTVR